MTKSNDPKSFKINFPCENYFLSAVANTHDGFIEILEDIVATYCNGYKPESLIVTASKNGKYQSFRFSVTAESEVQLAKLHNALKETGHVHMVI